MPSPFRPSAVAGLAGLAAAVAVVLSAGVAQAVDLKPGDAAPKLTVKEWIKGEPVTGFAKGKVYVVEFWATWCGPCKATIPHLTELQKKFKDVTFIGVAVWEEDQAKVKPFVAEMGEKMGYRVAVDEVPAGKEADSGAMATHWMKAAGQGGIPAAFVVDGEGRVAWIGHPGELEGPLSEVVAGKFDISAAAAKAKKEAERAGKMQAFQQKARAIGDNPKALLKLIDETIAADASMEKELGLGKFSLLRLTGQKESAIAFGQKLISSAGKDDAESLNELAWGLVAPDAPTKPDADFLKIALEAAKKADELSDGKNGAIADTYAKTLWDSGDKAKAIEVQERAVKLALKGSPEEQELRQRLEEYKKAAK
jgi:thiol-disulfide isomerase/thioredoxin